VGARPATVWSGPDDPPAGAAAPAQDPRIQAAFANFDAWLQRSFRPKAAAAVADIAVEEGVALARDRRQALLRLARSDPREALARALSPYVLKRLPLAVQEESESPIDVCGSSLDTTIGDDFSQGDVPVSRVKRTLTIGDRVFEAQVFGRRLGVTSKAIHANGIAIGNTVVLYESPLRRMDANEAAEDATVREQCGAPGPRCIAVKVGAQTLVFKSEAALRRHQAALERVESRLDPTQPADRPEALDPFPAAAPDITIASVWTTGEKHLLYIRVDFSDLAGDPVAADAAQTTIDGAVSTYYKDTSYNKSSLRATVTPTLRMPRTAAEYKVVGDGQLLTDARAAAKAAGFDPATFDRDVVAFASLFPGYSGKAYVGAKGVWLNGSFGSSVTVHELGHNYGVHHANLWQTTDGSIIGPGANVEYGNVFDVMGRGGIKGQMNAWFKSRLDWLAPTDLTSVTASGTYRIEPVDDPAAIGPRALKIVKNSTKNYWLEFRRLYTTNRWAMNGLMLNWGYNNNTGSHLLDTTPGSANAQNDAPVLVGRTFSDRETGIHITPIARATSPPSMDVVVKLGAFPGNTPPQATLLPSATTVGRDTPVTLTVTASDVNGDALAYAWVFDDGTVAPNSRVVSKSWSTNGAKLVQCIVSDMVGGTTTVSATVTVGEPTIFSIAGTVSAIGLPVPGVVVSDGTRSTTTNSAGAYVIQGVPNGTYTLTPARAGFTFTPATRTVTVSGSNVTGRNFVALATSANRLFEAHFNTGADGFVYVDDAFRGTTQPAYATGAWVAAGGIGNGALRVVLGGTDEADVVNMSGGWRRTFNLAAAQSVRLSLSYLGTQTPDYESDEFSEFVVTVDGLPLAGGTGVFGRLVGDGNGGASTTTGVRVFQGSLGTLSAGSHTLVIGGFNNKKTTTSESTQLIIDDVILFRP
jgi:PKD domain/Gametolysin peptidase M11